MWFNLKPLKPTKITPTVYSEQPKLINRGFLYGHDGKEYLAPLRILEKYGWQHQMTLTDIFNRYQIDEELQTCLINDQGLDDDQCEILGHITHQPAFKWKHYHYMWRFAKLDQEYDNVMHNIHRHRGF